MNQLKKSRAFWLFILMLACGFFLVGFASQNFIANLIAIILAFFVSRYGYDLLFKEYDEKNREKRELNERIYKSFGDRKKGEKK